MPPLKAFLVLCFFSIYTTYVFGQFLSFPFEIIDNSFLNFFNATNVTQTTKQVATIMNCLENCIEIPWCFSINFKKSAEESGLHLCEFLSSDVFSNEQNLQENEGYIHYSLKNPCKSSSPVCVNGGSCTFHSNKRDYRCICKAGYHGKQCEKDIDECGTKTHNCDNEDGCENTVGSYTCRCNIHRFFNGSTCVNFALDSPCLNYTNITDPTRLETHGLYPKKCDRTIEVKWYRFSGAGGVRMPTWCVPRYRCSTNGAGWLTQPHPTVAEGIVSSRVCFNYGRCCSYDGTIRVLNCHQYYLYELKPTSLCYLRYCSSF